jgi:hypothetical protein
VKALEEELLALYPVQQDPEQIESRRALLFFDDTGPIVVICPEAPEDLRGPLADETDVNYTRLHKYADLDALIEIFGHIRALNPDRHVLHRLPSDVQQAELQNHLVVLGGIAWNSTTRRILLQLKKLPIEQVEVAELPTEKSSASRRTRIARRRPTSQSWRRLKGEASWSKTSRCSRGSRIPSTPIAH